MNDSLEPTSCHSDSFPTKKGQLHSPLIYQIVISLGLDGDLEVAYEARYVHESNEDGLRLPLGVPGPFFTLPHAELNPAITRSLLRVPAPWSKPLSASGEGLPRRLDLQEFPDLMAMAICYASHDQVARYEKDLRQLLAQWCKEQVRYFRQASKNAKGSWWPWQ